MLMKASPATIARRFSIETTRPKPAEIDAVAAAVPKGAEIYITAVPTQTDDELVAAAAHARRAGLERQQVLYEGAHARVHLGKQVAGGRIEGVVEIEDPGLDIMRVEICGFDRLSGLDGIGHGGKVAAPAVAGKGLSGNRSRMGPHLPEPRL